MVKHSAMSADWRQYQEEAAAFFRSLGFQAAVDYTVQGVRSNHAIDVHVTFERWGMRHNWIVECKHQARAVTKADVETLKTIASEIGASLAFLLSESGFQSGAFAAAQKTNVVLSSLQELRSKSRDEVMREALGVLGIRCLKLRAILRDFMVQLESGPTFGRSRIRDGVDGQHYTRIVGVIAIVNEAFDQVRLGDFPVMLTGDFDADPGSYVRCTNLDQFVTEAIRIIERVEQWAAQQNPR
jgi:hypothetical protein